MPNQAELSIVIPCLNEAETLAGVLSEAKAGALGCGLEVYELIVVDNGSTDSSAAVAAQAGARVVEVRERGYGAALLGGIKAATSDYVIMADADGSYDLSQIQQFLDQLKTGFDLVMGSRFKGEIREGAMPFLNRWLGNPILTFIGNLFFGVGLSDFHCGMRGFRRQAILDLGLATSGMEFASEMVIKAEHAGLSIAEVPIVYYPDRRTRAPHLRPWRDGWRHLRFMLLYSPRWALLYPGMALAFVGGGLSLLLLAGPLELGSVTLDVHTLLGSITALTLGVQLILLAVLTRVYAYQVGLLPRDSRLAEFATRFSLEAGLTIGILLLVSGLGLFTYGLVLWGGRSFGPIQEYQTTLRVVMGGSASFMLGAIIFFSSFALTLVGQDRE